MPRSSNATRPLPAGSVRVDRRRRAVLPRGTTHQAKRRPTNVDDRAAIYSRWPQCPVAGEPCSVCTPLDFFVVLDTPANETRSIGNERGNHHARDHRKRLQQRVVFGVLANLCGSRHRPRLPVVVVLTRTTLRTSRMDAHAEWHKAIVDEIARWLGADDADQGITWEFRHATGERKGVRVQIVARTTEMERVRAENETRWRGAVGL
jgi:hypothetical protein